jgi:protein-disulfide isomerase
MTAVAGRTRASAVSPTENDFRGRSLIRATRDAIDQADGASGVDAAPPAPVMLIEFGDYQCPACRKAQPIVKALKPRFADRLLFRFRNFPLSRIHVHAMHAAEAAVSVRSQAGEEAFWAMHDAIFTHQQHGIDALDDTHLARYATDVGADGAQVLSDLDMGRFEETVEVDFVEGVRMGVSSTPTFFINGERFDGDWRDIVQFAAAIERAAASSATVAISSSQR